MSRKGKVCPDLLVGMIASYRAGTTIAEIADINDLAESTVWFHLEKNGISMRSPGTRRGYNRTTRRVECATATT